MPDFSDDEFDEVDNRLDEIHEAVEEIRETLKKQKEATPPGILVPIPFAGCYALLGIGMGLGWGLQQTNVIGGALVGLFWPLVLGYWFGTGTVCHP